MDFNKGILILEMHGTNIKKINKNKKIKKYHIFCLSAGKIVFLRPLCVLALGSILLLFNKCSGDVKSLLEKKGQEREVCGGNKYE